MIFRSKPILTGEQGDQLQRVVSRLTGRTIRKDEEIVPTLIESLEHIANRLDRLENNHPLLKWEGP